MVTIQLDEFTAAALRKQAANAGLDLSAYLRMIADRGTVEQGDWSDLERELDVLSSLGPSDPSNFSRSDIYADHD